MEVLTHTDEGTLGSSILFDLVLRSMIVSDQNHKGVVLGPGLQSHNSIALCLSGSDIAVNHQWRLTSSLLQRRS